MSTCEEKKKKKEVRRPLEFRFVGENRICVPQKHSRQFAATILGLSSIWRGWDEITLYVQTQLFLTYEGYVHSSISGRSTLDDFTTVSQRTTVLPTSCDTY